MQLTVQRSDVFAIAKLCCALNSKAMYWAVSTLFVLPTDRYVLLVHVRTWYIRIAQEKIRLLLLCCTLYVLKPSLLCTSILMVGAWADAMLHRLCLLRQRSIDLHENSSTRAVNSTVKGLTVTQLLL